MIVNFLLFRQESLGIKFVGVGPLCWINMDGVKIDENRCIFGDEVIEELCIFSRFMWEANSCYIRHTLHLH